jgi:hypothetical protein
MKTLVHPALSQDVVQAIAKLRMHCRLDRDRPVMSPNYAPRPSDSRPMTQLPTAVDGLTFQNGPSDGPAREAGVPLWL